MKKHAYGIGLVMLLLFAVGATQADLVAWWPLDEGSGQIVGDASGNGYDGFLGDNNTDAVKDPTWVVDGTRGNVLEWTWGDTDEYVNLNDQISHFSGLTQGTIMAWINRDAVEEYSVDVILGASDSGDASSDLRFLVNYRPVAYNYDAVFYRCRNNGDVTKDVRTDGSTSPFGGWHHVAVTVPGAGGDVKLYIDGVEQPLDPAGITTMDFFDHVQDIDTMGLGRNVDSGGTEMLFDGRMSDVAVYDTALPGSVIANIASGLWSPLAVDYTVTEGTPADGAAQIPTTSTLSWVQPPKAAGATYNVYLGTDTDLSDDFVGSTTGTSFIPTLAAGKTYYWRVNTVTATDSYEGVMFSFTTEGATLNHYPWDGMEGADPYTQPLSWEGDPTIASYDVYWGQQGSMSFQTNTTDTTWTATGQSPDTVYEWRIDTRDAGNNLIAVGPVLTYTTGALEAYWKLDEGSGTAVADSVGSFNGTSVDDTWTDGVVPFDGSTFGKAMAFDGDDNCVPIGLQPSLEGLPAVTVMAWVRPASHGYKPRIVDYNRQWLLLELNGVLTFSVYPIGSDSSVAANDTETVDPNDWYHVAGVSNGREMQIYVNGELKETVASSPLLPGNDSHLVIGARVLATGSDPDNYYDGRIDDVRIYSAALCAETIQSLYEKSSLARNPIPEDEDPAEPALQPITTDLQWTKGDSVNLQDVYLVKVDPLYGEDPNFNEPGALVFS
ncbi:MAG: LamG domain-containing protein, partial [Sedimentisphaerales bacterium]|nr:LamG domain-containing protein [Sedimentisphaerales bacterium]